MKGCWMKKQRKRRRKRIYLALTCFSRTGCAGSHVPVAKGFTGYLTLFCGQCCLRRTGVAWLRHFKLGGYPAAAWEKMIDKRWHTKTAWGGLLPWLPSRISLVSRQAARSSWLTAGQSATRETSAPLNVWKVRIWDGYTYSQDAFDISCHSEFSVSQGYTHLVYVRHIPHRDSLYWWLAGSVKETQQP